MLARRIASQTMLLTKVVVAWLVACLVTAVLVFVYLMNARPDLSVWHLADLDEEFTAKSSVTNFRQYLALEDRLF